MTQIEKDNLLYIVSEIRSDYSEVSNIVEWAELEEQYPKVSLVFKDIEALEKAIKLIKTTK